MDTIDEKAWDWFHAFWHWLVASQNEKTFRERLAIFEPKYGSKRLHSVGNIKMSQQPWLWRLMFGHQMLKEPCGECLAKC